MQYQCQFMNWESCIELYAHLRQTQFRREQPQMLEIYGIVQGRGEMHPYYTVAHNYTYNYNSQLRTLERLEAVNLFFHVSIALNLYSFYCYQDTGATGEPKWRARQIS